MSHSTYRTRAPAKLNIRLKVTGRRTDGYHELVSVMVPVDLHDLLEFNVLGQNRIEIASEGFKVPTDEGNLVYQAAVSFFSRTGVAKGLSIRLVKNIPVAAGLGGGSSDAAATLLSLNEIYSTPLSLPELHDLAIKLGADVPFFLNSCPSLARGVGEILEPLKNWPEFWYVIVTPPIRVSTSWVYENLKLELTASDYKYIVNSLKDDHFILSQVLENDLEKVTSARFPIIETLKRLLLDTGAEGAIMSGSGPSVFGLFSSFDQAISAKKALISRDLGDVFVAREWGRD